jgi:nitrite reductase/ring-hydroxylating ferredoxin subunit
VTPYQRPTDSVLIRRRTVIMNAGLAAAALAGLSSCTTYGTTPATEPSAPASGAGGSAAQALTAKTADIPVGSGKVFADAQTVITQPKQGEFKAFSAVCTHQSCLVDAVTNTINCPCHGSKYSITDGSVVNPPATQPLPPKTIKVSGNNLSVS